MQSITELAAARKAAYDAVGNSADETNDFANMQAVYDAEASILARLFTQAEAIDANLEILHQFGEPDWSAEFDVKLGRKILHALLPNSLSAAAAA
jgi:hypothetical protein